MSEKLVSQLNTMVEPQMKAQLKKLADENHMTVGAFTRKILYKYLDDLKK